MFPILIWGGEAHQSGAGTLA